MYCFNPTKPPINPPYQKACQIKRMGSSTLQASLPKDELSSTDILMCEMRKLYSKCPESTILTLYSVDISDLMYGS